MSPYPDETSALSQSDQGRPPNTEGVEERKQREIPKDVFSMDSLPVRRMSDLAIATTQATQEAEKPTVVEVLNRHKSHNIGLHKP